MELPASLRYFQIRFDLVTGDSTQDDAWARQGCPEVLVERFPELARNVVPGTVEIVRRVNRRVDFIHLWPSRLRFWIVHIPS